jgi:HEPN domain-containing protein
MAQDHLAWAGGSLGEAKQALEKKDYPRAIRRAQECIELSIKAILRALAIEFPKVHDVSEVIQSLGGIELPKWFEDSIPRIV